MMRCQYCGSNIIHPDKEHKTFSAGKAVAGAVTFGVVGAVTGFIGKDIPGYRCGSCGAFMDAPMDAATELSVDNAIRDAESGGSRAMFDYFKSQYGNIQANIPAAPVQAPQVQPAAQPRLEPSVPVVQAPVSSKADLSTSRVKYRYRPNLWNPDCPVFVECVIITSTQAGDTLSLEAYNQGSGTIRSAYFQAKVFDDTGDEITACQCVYQGLSVAEGKDLPVDKQFKLNTDLAYRVELYCEKIAMEDGSVWRASESDTTIALSEPAEINRQNFPRFHWLTFCLEPDPDAAPVGSLFLPVEHEDYWQCICGVPVKNGCKCPHCGENAERLKELVSQKKLQAVQQASVKDVASRRAAMTMKLYTSALEAQKTETYKSAAQLQEKDTEADLEKAAQLFDSIPDWKDSVQRAKSCRDRIPVLKAELEKKAEEEKRAAEEAAKREAEEKAAAEEKRKQKRKFLVKISSIAAAAIVVIVAGVLVSTKVIVPTLKYNSAVSLMDEGDYDAAIETFIALGDYKDAADRIPAAQYEKADALCANGQIAEAAITFGKIAGYSDARDRSLALWDQIAVRSSLDVGNRHTVGLKQAGTVVATGGNNYGECDVSRWGSIVAIAAGNDYTVGLKSNGTVVAVGDNSFGKCDVSDWTDIVAIAVGNHHAVGLKMDGTVVVVGLLLADQYDVSDWTDVVAISDSGYLIVGLKADGTVVATGDNDDGQCNVTSWRDIVAVSAGDYHTVGLKTDGTVVAVGDNWYGQCDVSDWTDIVAISAGYDYTVGLKSDGTVVAVGDNWYGQCDVSDWTDIVAISAGYDHTVGLKSDGTVVAVGDNEKGQCDVGNWRGMKVSNN
jgi:TolA-binding protein